MTFFKGNCVLRAIFYLTALVLFQISFDIYAANKEPIAEVVTLKGKATQLAPHSKTAAQLQVGDKLLEDTSILTEDRSFVRIKFRDGSFVSLGAASKMVLVEMAKNDVSLISLLKGKLRSKVEKDNVNGSANKFYIKTRSAAMGVRGTDFQAIYNPENKLTSLVTFKGEVAMAKVDPVTHQELDRLEKNEKTNIEVSRADDGKVEIQKTELDSMAQLQKLDKILNHQDAVVVEAGQYSGSSDSLKKTSIPVKINPAQFEVLLKNQDLTEKKVENLKSSELLVASNEVSKLMVDSKADPNGFFDAKTGDFAPKSGGVVDLETGLYVAPDASAKFDSNTRVYVSQRIGGVDKETGQYVPPTGLKLDSNKGFVEVAKTSDPQVLSLKEDLNKTAIQKDIVIGSPVEKEFKLENKFLRDEVSVALMLGGMSKAVSGSGGQLDKDSESYSEFRLKWAMSSALRFRPLLEFRYKTVKFSNDARYSHGDETAFDIFTGLQYSLSKRANFLVHFGIRQDVYAQNSATAGSYQFTRMGITELGLGYQYDYDFTDKFMVKSTLLPYYAFSRDVGNVGTKTALGVRLELMPTYSFKENSTLGIGFSLDSSKRDVTTLSNGTAKDDTAVGGLVFQYSTAL